MKITFKNNKIICYDYENNEYENIAPNISLTVGCVTKKYGKIFVNIWDTNKTLGYNRFFDIRYLEPQLQNYILNNFGLAGELYNEKS